MTSALLARVMCALSDYLHADTTGFLYAPYGHSPVQGATLYVSTAEAI